MQTTTYTFLQKQGLKSKIQPLEYILNLFIIICIYFYFLTVL